MISFLKQRGARVDIADAEGNKASDLLWVDSSGEVMGADRPVLACRNIDLDNARMQWSFP